jgi:hypothetical protein
MRTALIISALAIALPCFGQSSMERRLVCLAMVETGCNDMAIGPSGERGRYQETLAVFKEFNPTNCWQFYYGLTNADFARLQAEGVMLNRLHRYGRVATDTEFYLLWHRPARPNHPKPAEKDRALRFQNLCLSKTAN